MDYVNGGVWSEKAAKEAGKWAQVHQPAGSMDTEAGLSYPPAEQWWVLRPLATCRTSRQQSAAPLLSWQMVASWNSMVDSSERLRSTLQGVSDRPRECLPQGGMS